MDSLGCKKGWLVVFNRDRDMPWDKKLSWKEVKKDAARIVVVGMLRKKCGEGIRNA